MSTPFDPLALARAEALDAEETTGPLRQLHLAATQAYATLAIAEALRALAATPPRVLVGVPEDVTRGYL